jgi:hypothetical protein
MLTALSALQIESFYVRHAIYSENKRCGFLGLFVSKRVGSVTYTLTYRLAATGFPSGIRASAWRI